MGATKEVLEILDGIQKKTTIEELISELDKNNKYALIRRIAPNQLKYFIEKHNKKYEV